MRKTMIASSLFLLITSVNLSGSILDGIKGMQRIDIQPSSHQSSPLSSKEKTQHLAGYIAAVNLENPVKGSVSSVTASWIVPTLESAGKVWIWTRIDGADEIWAERLGTMHFLQGEQKDVAWIQPLPGLKIFATNFPLTSNDHVAAEVNCVGNGQFHFVFINYTQNAYFDYLAEEKKTLGLCETAAWMVESSQDLMLPDFGTIPFSECSATIDSVAGPINSTVHKALNMKFRKWGTEATTSDLSLDGKSFGVTWVHY